MTIVGAAFTGCTPMDDINEEIDAELNQDNVVGAVDYTLTDEDYEALELPFGSFNSLEEARTLIPDLLNDVFPVLGNGSLVNATFALYDPIRVEEYAVTADDYTTAGLSNDYFSSESEITTFLKAKFPQAQEGSYVELTYSIIADEILYTLNDADFDVLGEALSATYPEPASSASQYSNFDRRDDRDAYWSNDMILEALNAVLLENFDNVAGQKYNVSYAIYDGSAGKESMTVQFDGNAYVAVGGTAYEFVNEDFALVGTELAEAYPLPAESAASYNNFDRREDRDAYWSESMLLEAVNIVLAQNFPSAAEGDKFEVSYAIYNGAAGVEIMSVILTGDEYVMDTEASISTIEETKVFAYTNNAWNAPYTLASEDYTEMGQSYPNFDDEDEAIYKIAIFLESLYQYAEEGDFVSVAYNFYDDGVTTEYANFVFEGGEFSNIPSVISHSLQFGNDGTTWVPDNTIRLGLTGADYSYIGAELADKYPNPASSMARYGNLDRRSGNSAYWSDEMILEAMNILLDHLDPSAEEGQKYVLSYDIYNGSAGVEEISVIKTGGVWVLN